MLASLLKQLLQEEVGALGALPLDHGAQRLHPFACFLGIQVAGAAAVLSVVRCHACLLLIEIELTGVIPRCHGVSHNAFQISICAFNFYIMK
ncbi:hypothetical protein FQZ97_946040 [compost metagenome]